MNDQNIAGGRQLDEFLKQLAPNMEKNIMKAALRAGAAVLVAEIKATAPVAPPSSKNAKMYGGYPGALRDSVKASADAKNGTVTARVTVGGKSKKGKKADVYYARWVEFGTRPHKITAKNAKALSIGGKRVRSVDHPGAKAGQPFVRPAFDSKAPAAIEAIAATIRAKLTLRGITVPEPDPPA